MTTTPAADSTATTTEKSTYKPPVRFDETVEDLFDEKASAQTKLENGLQDSGMTAAFRSPDSTAINEVMSVAINSFADELSTLLEKAEGEEIPEAFAEVIGLIEDGMTEAASHKDFIDMVGVLQGGLIQLKEESDDLDITNKMFKTALENTMEDIRMQVRKSFGVDSEEYNAIKVFQEGVGEEMYKGLLTNLTV